MDQQSNATIPNIPDARFWGDVPPPSLDAMLRKIEEQRRASGMDAREVTVLVLSGGGDDGAYGAGLLNAWSELGTRPEFDIVTGVSTGALSAPFAFLGPEYDDKLRLVYGGLPARSIFRFRSWVSILQQASVVDVSPLEKIIEEFMDEAMATAIAREHAKGRRILVQSTNLDAQRPIIWDIGAIASSAAPNRLDVIKQALLASASIPVAFPPVLIEVDVNGSSYDEMHVDGGTISEDTVLFGWQQGIQKFMQDTAPGKKATYYIVRNGKVGPEAASVDYSLMEIAKRALSTLIKSQGNDNLITSAGVVKKRGAEYNASWIGDDFNHPYPAPFDPGYMKALYQYGYEKMRNGQAWINDAPYVALESAEDN
ncbi:patatin-like phospholipase family protein [Paralimibaculum aggregatum]|uniref:Patatin-like phospholipase family protein n=1 Tax=Paralimibaculum aggregatum TaxID=3036245 RepID=A0ABQ6LSY8_9RHOB|nr:patatin-like phospholipase family protein [Limibaculum sp. NKW23]GMG85183.1 patatin-like phospholipase family protein [Limibaculum sp. NKW23]